MKQSDQNASGHGWMSNLLVELFFVRMITIRKFLAYGAVVCIGLVFVSILHFFLVSFGERSLPANGASGRLLPSLSRKSDKDTGIRQVDQRFSNKLTISERLQLEGQARRKRHIRKVCQKLNSSGQLLSKNKTLTPFHFRAIIVDDNHRLLYCEVPKVACTNWKRVLLMLSGKMNTTQMEDLRSDEVHGTLGKTQLKRLNEYTMEEIQHRLHEYYKFIFVREPFERLLSAYYNKFTTRYNEMFKRVFGRRIVKTFRTNPTNESLQGGHDVTFEEFVAYLLDPKTTKRQPFNGHWRQYHELCHPCLVNYDFIGKYETMQEDADMTLSQLGVRRIVNFPTTSPRRTRTSDLVAQKFANISTDDIHRLWKLYSADFDLFDYPYPNFGVNSTTAPLT